MDLFSLHFNPLESKVPKLCLNMIVKNESKIILRLLDSVSKYIDTYCICDTGSTDNTVEMIRMFFKARNIPGKIIFEPFRDFGYNRSFSLKACEEMDADYILLLDADMVLWVDPNISPNQFKHALTKDLFYLYQGTDAYYYKNTRIVKNKGFTYWGVTHEYVKSPPDAKAGQIEKQHAFIKDIGDGGSKSDKAGRDIRLLTAGLVSEPNNDRYTFYLANSYHDSGEYEKAIELYEKRIELGGWIEEVWYSYYKIGKCYACLKKMDSAICAWMNGYEKYPNRIENLFEIIQHYRVHGKTKLAYFFYLMADDSRNKYLSRDYLFMRKDIYDYKLDYEFSVFGYYHNPDSVSLSDVCMKVISYPHVEQGILTNTIQNYKFYRPLLTKENISNAISNAELFSQIGKTLNIPSDFVSSTPTFCVHPADPTKWIVIVRFVNYVINKEGGYENKEFIETKNVFAVVSNKIEYECFLKYNTTLDNVYVGLEDIRLSVMNGKVRYNANRGLDRGKMVVEHGWIDLNGETREEQLLEYPTQNKIEKNWVMLGNHIIYSWHPLIIGEIKTVHENGHENGISERSLFHKTHEINTPSFFKSLRGSCNGIRIGNEHWVLCHLVSYEDRRYYYHIMVVLDESFHLKKYSHLFTFEGEKVEYCLGIRHLADTMKHLEDTLFFGYSVMDRETKYLEVKKEWFDKRMIQYKV